MDINNNQEDHIWESIQQDVQIAIENDNQIEDWMSQSILRHSGFKQALASTLAKIVCDSFFNEEYLEKHFIDLQNKYPLITDYAMKDLCAYVERDAACSKLYMPLLFFKGYQALQLQRFSNYSWQQQQHLFSYFLQNRMSCQFGVDIHPAVQLGYGIMLDHGTGIVMGETTVVGNNVSILHGVTLGGSGIKDCCRHPKIGDGVLIGAGAQILGPVVVGENAKVASGSLVLEDVSACSTVAGVPALEVGTKAKQTELPSLMMDQNI
jgi:serine O-acetyltransferase